MLLLALAGSSVANATDDDGGEKYAKEAAASVVGQKAPALTITTIDGKTIDLGRLYGHKTVYLKFWATWCVPCREQMPHFEHAYETAGPDTVVIGINTNFNETKEGVEAFRKKFGLKMPIVMDDGRLAEAFHLRVTPQHIVIDRNGRVAYVGHAINASLEAALAGTESPARPPEAKKIAADGTRGQLTTLDGRTFELGASPSHRSRILVFLSPWCEGYLAQSQPLASAQCRSAREQAEKLRANPGAQWLGIASGLWSDDTGLRAYRKDNNVTLALALDKSGDVFRRYNVKRVPTVILVDAEGKEVQRLTGDMRNLPALVARAASLGKAGS
ncbi:redoxin family protein [Luteibacter sp.]|jgi:peroxiredoxin|uniref:redoxin family protein n=1 Tax=Luteibacter sp. TaxID=1886636 RepID=UPI002F406FD3